MAIELKVIFTRFSVIIWEVERRSVVVNLGCKIWYRNIKELFIALPPESMLTFCFNKIAILKWLLIDLLVAHYTYEKGKQQERGAGIKWKEWKKPYNKWVEQLLCCIFSSERGKLWFFPLNFSNPTALLVITVLGPDLRIISIDNVHNWTVVNFEWKYTIFWPLLFIIHCTI